jgi:hypothetical protein
MPKHASWRVDVSILVLMEVELKQADSSSARSHPYVSILVLMEVELKPNRIH